MNNQPNNQPNSTPNSTSNSTSNSTYIKLTVVIIAIIGVILAGFSVFSKNVKINALDIVWSYCDSNFYAGKKIFCRFHLDHNKTYSGLSSGYKIAIENSDQASTCWLEEKALICNDIPTDNLQEGKKNVLLQLDKNDIITKEIEVTKQLKKGVNVTHWFRYGEKTKNNYLEYMNEKEIQNIKEFGFDHIRLPIDVSQFYEDSYMYDYLGLAVKKITDQGLVVIVDGHSQSLNSALETNPSARQKYTTFWTQLSERLKGFDYKKVYIEPYNEPAFEKNNQLWSQFQLELYQAIRNELPKNTIVLTANNKSYFNSFADIELPKDPNIMLDLHYYSEFVYTHQGVDFSSDFLESVKGLAYPYDKDNCDSNFNAQTNKESKQKVLEYCNNKTNYTKQKELIQKNIQPLQAKGYKVIIGEYGAFSCHKDIAPNTEKIIKESKIQYLRDVSRIFEELNIPSTLWGYDDCFGLNADKVNGVFEYDKDYLGAVLGK
jgi:endoglucanase